MAKHEIPEPTGRELEILRILWDSNPGTVRQVNEQMNKQQKTGYTTTLKLMQIMTGKRLLLCDKSNFQHLYRPAVSEEKAQNQLVSNLLEKAFSGSTKKLVMRALSTGKVSTKEMAEITKILDKTEGK